MFVIPGHSAGTHARQVRFILLGSVDGDLSVIPQLDLSRVFAKSQRLGLAHRLLDAPEPVQLVELLVVRRQYHQAAMAPARSESRSVCDFIELEFTEYSHAISGAIMVYIRLGFFVV